MDFPKDAVILLSYNVMHIFLILHESTLEIFIPFQKYISPSGFAVGSKFSSYMEDLSETDSNSPITHKI